MQENCWTLLVETSVTVRTVYKHPVPGRDIMPLREIYYHLVGVHGNVISAERRQLFAGCHHRLVARCYVITFSERPTTTCIGQQ